MSAWSGSHPFTKDEVLLAAPRKQGVYALFIGGELVYYGQSEDNIQGRLLSHLAGQEVPATQTAQRFMFAACTNSVQAEIDLLNHCMSINKRLPRFNSKIG